MELWYAIATVSLALVYITGIFCCIIVIVWKRRILLNKNSFEIIIKYKSIACTILLTILLFWIIPCCIWHFDVTHTGINTRIGYAVMLLNAPIYISNVVVSANRLIAIVMPSKLYLFSGTSILRILLAVSLISILYSLLYIHEDCSLYFNSEDLLFYFPKTKCGELVALYGDFLSGVTMFTMCLLMDIVSIFYLQKSRKRIANTITTAMNKERFQMEVIMTAQTFINSSLFYIMIFSYHFVGSLSDAHPMVMFLCTNFLWSLVIASSGYTSVMIIAEIRKMILHPVLFYRKKLSLPITITKLSKINSPTEFLRG